MSLDALSQHLIAFDEWRRHEKAVPARLIRLAIVDRLKALPFSDLRPGLPMRIDNKEMLLRRRPTLNDGEVVVDIYMHGDEPDPGKVLAALLKVLPPEVNQLHWQRQDLSPPRFRVDAIASEYGRRISTRGIFHELETADLYAARLNEEKKGHHMHYDVSEETARSISSAR